MPHQTTEAPAKPLPISAATDQDVARYIAEMTVELQGITAGRPRFTVLRYLLDMARLEAERAAQGRMD